MSETTTLFDIEGDSILFVWDLDIWINFENVISVLWIDC